MAQANSPDWAAIRAAYENGGASVRAICKAHSVSLSAFYHCRDRQGWRPRRPAALARQIPVADDASGRQTRRQGLVSRLFDALERQMLQIERRIGAEPEADETSSASRERDARTLASLVRTLEKLFELDAGAGGPSGEGRTHRDIDELRRALAERIERLASGGAGT